MNLTPEAHDFATTILKHYGPNAKATVNPAPTQQAPKAQQINPKGARNGLDYSKWDNFNPDADENDPASQQAPITPDDELKKMVGCFHDRRKERELFDKKTEEKLEAAERFKQEGNKHVQKKDYEKASTEYQKAILQFDYTFPDTPEEDKQMQKLQESVHSNLALVQYHLKDFDNAIQNCDQETERGLEIDPQEKNFIDLEVKIKAKIADMKKKENKMYQNMFG